MRVIDTNALNHLGAVVQAIRPQWDRPGILAALEEAIAGDPYPDVALVAISSARDPKAATPAVIPHRIRNGWTATRHDDIQRTPTVDSLEGRCRCGMWVVCGEQHECARPADPALVRDAIEASKKAIATSKQALAAARAAHTPTKETT